MRKRYAEWRLPAHKDTLQLCGLHAIFPGLRLVRYKASNILCLDALGYILLIATAGTSLQVEALHVGGAPSLTTVVPRIKVKTLITTLFRFLASHSYLPANALQGQGLVTQLLWVHQLHHVGPPYHLSEFCLKQSILHFHAQPSC